MKKMPIPGYLSGAKKHTHSIEVIDTATHAGCGATGAAYATATDIKTTKTVNVSLEKG